jgi:hypothetical protein
VTCGRAVDDITEILLKLAVITITPTTTYTINRSTKMYFRFISGIIKPII